MGKVVMVVGDPRYLQARLQFRYAMIEVIYRPDYCSSLRCIVSKHSGTMCELDRHWTRLAARSRLMMLRLRAQSAPDNHYTWGA